MSEAAIFNLQAFTPLNGGTGARIAATTSSQSVAVPGLEGGQQNEKTRVVVSNGGSVPVYVRFGVAGIVATTSDYEILPGTKEVLSPPYLGPNAIRMAAICATGSTSVNVCAGIGT